MHDEAATKLMQLAHTDSGIVTAVRGACEGFSAVASVNHGAGVAPMCACGSVKPCTALNCLVLLDGVWLRVQALTSAAFASVPAPFARAAEYNTPLAFVQYFNKQLSRHGKGAAAMLNLGYKVGQQADCTWVPGSRRCSCQSRRVYR